MKVAANDLMLEMNYTGIGEFMQFGGCEYKAYALQTSTPKLMHIVSIFRLSSKGAHKPKMPHHITFLLKLRISSLQVF